ncbi:hypothetical protein B0H14DRAFT_2587252 [Mycena olivaceomarginata]|nr:hypothetical protein B0H14DRAFT_2587252 [Mycena olivaceomarginata]
MPDSPPASDPPHYTSVVLSPETFYGPSAVLPCPRPSSTWAGSSTGAGSSLLTVAYPVAELRSFAIDSPVERFVARSEAESSAHPLGGQSLAAASGAFVDVSESSKTSAVQSLLHAGYFSSASLRSLATVHWGVSAISSDKKRKCIAELKADFVAHVCSSVCLLSSDLASAANLRAAPLPESKFLSSTLELRLRLGVAGGSRSKHMLLSDSGPRSGSRPLATKKTSPANGGFRFLTAVSSTPRLAEYAVSGRPVTWDTAVDIHSALDKRFEMFPSTLEEVVKKKSTNGPSSSMFLAPHRPFFIANATEMDEGRLSEFDDIYGLLALVNDPDVRFNRVPEVLVFNATTKKYFPMSFHQLHRLGTGVVLNVTIAPMAYEHSRKLGWEYRLINITVVGCREDNALSSQSKYVVKRKAVILDLDDSSDESPVPKRITTGSKTGEDKDAAAGSGEGSGTGESIST